MVPMSDADPRTDIQLLLDERSPADALAAYYALHHERRRTRLYVHTTPRGHTDAFLAVCQTGLDLFRPVAVLHAPGAEATRALLREGLSPGRPHFLIGPRVLLEWAGAVATLTEPNVYRVYILAAQNFRPVINVLVQREPAGAGGGNASRWLIRGAGGEIAALAGINWRSPLWAEVYVQVHPGARGRGLGRSVVSACTAWLLEQRLRPLYLVAEDNDESISLAEAVGYHDTGNRMFMAEAVIGH
jgi:GNAT superfamily N-acetyltransferase